MKGAQVTTKPGRARGVCPFMSPSIDPTAIDDRDMGPGDPVDPASLQHPDATLCPECQGTGALVSGETCPVCEGTGKAVGRTGGG